MSEEQDKQGDPLMSLGTWLGRHQAFGWISNRCSAASAECLKTIRDGQHYQELGLTWEQFCVQFAGVSRPHADRLIHYLDRFGPNYFRMAEFLPISPKTYELIAGKVSDQGLESNGEVIPIARENRRRIAAAVNAARKGAKPSKDQDQYFAGKVGLLRMRLEGFLDDLHNVATKGQRVPEVMMIIEEGTEGLRKLALSLQGQ